MIIGIMLGFFAAFILLLGGAFLLGDEALSDPYLTDESDEPCDECNADGAWGECTVCGWIDHLAVAQKEHLDDK